MKIACNTKREPL